MRKILIANRGEIARRIQRTCREMGIAHVAVFSEADRDAPFATEADESVAIGGAAPADSYLRIDAMLDAARATGADAVHPGYGFLAENAEFAQRCADAGLVFIGPPPEAIAVMGSKIEAKRRMQRAGVPLVPSCESCEPADADKLGFPLLVKASAGGGGKGMRIVRSRDGLADAVESARREAKSAFGDGTVFLERYLEAARHVEVQIFGDQHGRVVHLYERECSVQRRHQKILEEAPSPAVDAALRDAICKAAVAAGETIGYQGAGTVEFMLAASGEFFFLEMNTRLQVEHPVTELVTGLDLVRMQIEVARGTALREQSQIPPLRGHAIEARLYAEDPARDFLPTTGTLHRFAFEPVEGLRVDAGVEDGSTVSVHYDPMLAKVIAWGADRERAAHRLVRALSSARIHGVRTNRALLVRLLGHEEFLAGRTDTEFLTRHDPAELGAPLCGAEAERVHALAACLAAQAERRARARVLGGLPSGWRNVPSQYAVARFDGAHGEVAIEYRWDRGRLSARLDGEAVPDVRLHAAGDGIVDLEAHGVRRRYEVSQVAGVFYVDSALGASELREVPRFPVAEREIAAGSLVAPMPGTVQAVYVAVGDRVAAGQTLVLLEAMKMEQKVVAPRSGRVSEVRAREGEQVEAGLVLVVIEEEDA